MSRTPRRGKAWAPVRSVDGRVAATFSLFAVAFLLGGASRENEYQLLVIQLISLAALGWMAWRGPSNPPPVRSRLLAVAILAILALPLLQIIPLPSSWWTGLPGRDLVLGTMQAAGLPAKPASLSLSPESTLRALLWLVPVCVTYWLATSLSSRASVWLVVLILGLCLVSLIVGVAQIADRGGSLLTLYPTTHTGLPVGIFSNRNHQGIAMAAAIPFAACLGQLPSISRGQARRLRAFVYVGVTAVLAAGALATQSRTAVLLLAPALLAGAIIFVTSEAKGALRRETWLAIGAVGALLAAGALIGMGAVVARFGALGIDREGRFDAWPVVIDLASSVQPVGSGLGTFEAAYRSAEPLKLLSPFYFNHAHNDYLELWLEAGIFFPLIMTAFLGWVVQSTIRVWRCQPDVNIVVARASSASIAVLLLHSMVDYPLRTPALACLFAVCCALLASGASAARSNASARPA